MFFWKKQEQDQASGARSAVQGRPLYVNDTNSSRRHKRNVMRVNRIRQKMARMHPDDPKRASFDREMRRRLFEIEEYEAKHGGKQ